MITHTTEVHEVRPMRFAVACSCGYVTRDYGSAALAHRVALAHEEFWGQATVVEAEIDGPPTPWNTPDQSADHGGPQ